MSKKRILRLIRYLIISLAVLFAVILVGVNLPFVQKVIVARANAWAISKGIPARVGRVNLLITGRIGISDARLSMPDGDTVIYADKISSAGNPHR